MYSLKVAPSLIALVCGFAAQSNLMADREPGGGLNGKGSGGMQTAAPVDSTKADHPSGLERTVSRGDDWGHVLREIEFLTRRVNELEKREGHLISFNSLIFGGIALIVTISGFVVAIATRKLREGHAAAATHIKEVESQVIERIVEQMRQKLLVVGEAVYDSTPNVPRDRKLQFRACMNILSLDPHCVRGGLQHLRIVPDKAALGIIYTVREHWKQRAEQDSDELRRKAERVLQDIDNTIDIIAATPTD